MKYLLSAWQFIVDPSHWSGYNSIGLRLAQHMGYSLIAVAVALIIGLPLGMYLGHTGRGASAALAASGALRALPSLGLLTWLTLSIGIGITLPIIPSIIVLFILGVPPVLGATISGFQSVSGAVVDSARAMGYNEWQIVRKVELPLAAPTIVGGIRSCVVQILATATICAYVGLGGLGRYLIDGLAISDYSQVIVGALLVTILALVVDLVLAGLQRCAIPAGS